MDKSLSGITDEESLARILFSPSHVCEGRVSPKAFKMEMLKGGAEDYISVLRCDDTQLEAVSKGFRPRITGDVRYGFTRLIAGDVRSLNDEFEYRDVKVLSRPSKHLHCHAGIFLSLNGRLQTAVDISPDIDLFQKELSMLCDGVHVFEDLLSEASSQNDIGFVSAQRI